jgi:hypothetical protein
VEQRDERFAKDWYEAIENGLEDIALEKAKKSSDKSLIILR